MESTVEQRTEEWLQSRLGRFTASEIYKLMGVRGLGETGKTYATDKAIEQLFGKVEENFVSYDMQRGIELEPLAFAKFKELKSLEFIDVQTCGFFELGDNAGASPDGLVGDDAILEIKCPKANTFFELVATNDVDKKYYYQMQIQMMATNRNKAYFFNYYILDGVEYHHTIEVERDDEVCELMLKRIAEANEIKENMIKQININKQF